MSSTKLTPIDILKRRKIRLQVKSDALIDILEDNFTYLQNNAVSLASETAADTFISKLPPFVQSLLGKGHKVPWSEALPSSDKLSGIAMGALDFLPILFRGKKGIVATLLIRMIKKLMKS
ncbi:hypothetical protein M2138_001567 [Dysgonomonadaceae bacterium PH5-43]|nr:hypothetical protein [Dysgonomonadaceae bacterium PH5-43]